MNINRWRKFRGAGPSISDLKEEITTLKQKITEKDVLIGNLDIRVSDLEEENFQKSKQISDLQLNLGALSAGYFDLKNKLIAEFGDKFKTIVEEPCATAVIKFQDSDHWSRRPEFMLATNQGGDC